MSGKREVLGDAGLVFWTKISRTSDMSSVAKAAMQSGNGRAGDNQPVAVAHQTAQCHDIFGWSERGLQHTVAMQLLNPLAVPNVALATRQILGFPSVGQLD